MLAKKSNSKNGYIASIRQNTFALLEKNPLLTAKSLCKLMDLPYEKYLRYMNKLRYEWKSNHKNEHGSKCSIHAWRGWCYVPANIRRDTAVREGWIESRARNRWFLWKDRLGRLQWFETGRVNLYLRKPVNLGKAYQLVCNGFSFTGLITDIKVLEMVLTSVRFKGAHYVFEGYTAVNYSRRLRFQAQGSPHGEAFSNPVIRLGDKDISTLCSRRYERSDKGSRVAPFLLG